MQKHFAELRKRLLNSLLVLAVVFFVFFYFSNSLYETLAAPILKHLPNNTQVITTQVIAPFMVPMQLSFICAILISAPYILYQLWMFIKPGLYIRERKFIAPIICISGILFYIGCAFALFIVSPVALRFFSSSAPNGVTVMLDIGNFLDFVVTVCLACGIAFQIPVITSVLTRCGVISKAWLTSKRKHVIVLTMIIGMILAPPDVISQLLLAIPMWALFEIGLLCG